MTTTTTAPGSGDSRLAAGALPRRPGHPLIGAGCGRSAGLPDWAGLLRGLEARFEKDQLLDGDKRGCLKAWFRDKKDFPRIAELLKTTANLTYLQVLQPPSIRSPAPGRSGRPGTSSSSASFLARILTTNFDRLLEDALGGSWTSLTWQDMDDFARFLRSPKPSVFHIHGTAAGAPHGPHQVGVRAARWLRGREGAPAPAKDFRE